MYAMKQSLRLLRLSLPRASQPKLLPNRKRLDVPDALRVLVDAPVAGKEAHASHRRDALGHPLVLVPVRLVDQGVRLDVAAEVVRHQVVVSMLPHGGNQRAKVVGRPERALFDLAEHPVQVAVDRVGAVGVRVAKVLDVFCEVAKQEDVVLANLTSNLNLRVR